MNTKEYNDNWTTPQALAKELNINPSVIYGWIKKKQIASKQLPGGLNTLKVRYLVDKSTQPPIRSRGRVW
jgi:hypothetical protein